MFEPTLSPDGPAPLPSPAATGTPTATPPKVTINRTTSSVMDRSSVYKESTPRAESTPRSTSSTTSNSSADTADPRAVVSESAMANAVENSNGVENNDPGHQNAATDKPQEPAAVEPKVKDPPPRPPRANTQSLKTTVANNTVHSPSPVKATSIDAEGAEFTSPRARSTAVSKKPKKDKESPPKKTSPTPPPPSASGEPTAAQQRIFVANEIVESERNYLRDLQVIIELYLTPLKSNGIVSAVDLRTIFSQVEVISKISETLLKKLQAAMEAHQSQGVEIKFGKPILELCDFMKSYSMYVNNYEMAMQVVQQYKRTNKKFVKFLAETMKHERVRNHTIEDYLIIVIQRIPRYVLLLSEIVKVTPETHEDFADLSKALVKVKDIADYVNAAKKRIEMLQRGVDIQNQVGIKDVPAHRIFVDEDVFYESRVEGVAEKDLPRNHFALYLFSDIIVLAKYKGNDLVKVKIQDIIKSSFSSDESDGSQLNLVLDAPYQLFHVTSEAVARTVKTWQDSRSSFEKDMLALEQRRKASSADETTDIAAAAVAAASSSAELRVKSPGRRGKKSSEKRETPDS